MEFLILNENFETETILDTFSELIWVDRYCGYGDFEICTTVTNALLNYLRQGYYIWYGDSEHTMIIESIAIKSEIDQGNRLLVTGRSLESLLDRRIVWEQTVLYGNFQTEIQRLLNESIISPVIADRAITNFIFEVSTDPVITALTIDAQFARSNLYETIQQLCMANNIGFKVTLSDTNQFIFKLYAGADRSYDQIMNPYVVFSPNFENIIDSNYSESQTTLKTVAIVAGEADDEGVGRKATIVGGGTGLERREVYMDARDISQKVDGELLSDEEYISRLAQRGVESLVRHVATKSFDGNVDAVSLFKYGEHFFMGDVVQIDSGYGIKSKSRVIELIHSQSANGFEIYPTFMMIDVDQFETDGELITLSGGEGTIGSVGSGGTVVVTDSTYVHNQISASAAWTINHNLNKYPSVTIVNLSGTVFIGDVDYINANSLIVSFSGEFSGKAYLN